MKAANHPAMATINVTTNPGWLMLFSSANKEPWFSFDLQPECVEKTYTERTLLPRAMVR